MTLISSPLAGFISGLPLTEKAVKAETQRYSDPHLLRFMFGLPGPQRAFWNSQIERS